jgi:hypothetical protein
MWSRPHGTLWTITRSVHRWRQSPPQPPNAGSLSPVDASALYAAAARIDELAAAVQARAALIGLHGATLEWHSPAARAYFAYLDDITAALTGCATRMTDLAELARRHAAALAGVAR